MGKKRFFWRVSIWRASPFCILQSAVVALHTSASHTLLFTFHMILYETCILIPALFHFFTPQTHDALIDLLGLLNYVRLHIISTAGPWPGQGGEPWDIRPGTPASSSDIRLCIPNRDSRSLQISLIAAHSQIIQCNVVAKFDSNSLQRE